MRRSIWLFSRKWWLVLPPAANALTILCLGGYIIGDAVVRSSSDEWRDSA